MLIITRWEMEPAIDCLAKDGEEWQRQRSCLEWRRRNNPAEWPEHHDYPQNKEKMLKVKT